MSFFSSIRNSVGSAFNSVASGIRSVYNTVASTFAGGNNSTNTGGALQGTYIPSGTSIYNALYPIQGPTQGPAGSKPSSPGSSASYGPPAPTSFSSGSKTGSQFSFGGGSSGGKGASSDYSSPSYSGNFSNNSAPQSAPVSTNVIASDIGTGSTKTISPSTPGANDYKGSLNGGSVSVGADPNTGLFNNNATVDAGKNKEKTQQQVDQENFDKYVNERKDYKSSEELQNKALQESNLMAVQQQRNNTQNQINGITTKLNTDLLQLRGTAGREGVTEAVYGGQHAELTREATISLLPLQAQLASDQNNLELAQTHFDTLFKIYTNDNKNSVDNYNKNLDLAYGFMTDSQKKRADEIKTQKEQNFQLAKQDIAFQQDIALELLKAGNAKAAAEISRIRPPSNQNSASYAQDYQNYKSDLSSVISKYGASTSSSQVSNPKYASVLNTILGSSKFTAEQKKTVINAINNGEDPFTVVKNQAKSIMGQTEATNVTKLEVARDTLSNIGDQLSQFYVNGGKTNIFSGNFEKIINKLGSISDPKLVNLATQIQGNLQVYRNAISGTAYSAQEGKDISSIFPGINKSESLNRAILSGRNTLFDSVIDSTYRSALGSNYDKLKTLNTAYTVPAVDPQKTAGSYRSKYNY